MSGSTPDSREPSESDIHLVAYASLHETVRRFLAGEANVKYLRKRHEDIEEDLQRAVVAARLSGEGGQDV